MPRTPSGREQPGELLETGTPGKWEQTGTEHQLHHHDQDQRRHRLPAERTTARDGQTDGALAGEQGERDEQPRVSWPEKAVAGGCAAAGVGDNGMTAACGIGDHEEDQDLGTQMRRRGRSPTAVFSRRWHVR